MCSVAQQIEGRIACFERGRIFFADDFMDIGSSDAVRQTLSRLNASGMIVRVAQGVYCYPEVDYDHLGLGAVSPSPEKIAEAIASRSHARIVPTGEYAQNALGLSSQVPMNFVFLTDGPSRQVKMANGRDIKFKRVAPKMVSFTNELAMLLTLALMSIKRENVTPEQVHHIGVLLHKTDRDAVLSDQKLMPLWIREIVNEAYNN